VEIRINHIRWNAGHYFYFDKPEDMTLKDLKKVLYEGYISEYRKIDYKDVNWDEYEITIWKLEPHNLRTNEYRLMIDMNSFEYVEDVKDYNLLYVSLIIADYVFSLGYTDIIDKVYKYLEETTDIICDMDKGRKMRKTVYVLKYIPSDYEEEEEEYEEDELFGKCYNCGKLVKMDEDTWMGTILCSNCGASRPMTEAERRRYKEWLETVK